MIIAALGVLGVLALLAVLFVDDAPGGNAPSLGGKNYRTSVDCQAKSSGSQATVTINGTINGDAADYAVTVEVFDTASRQRLAVQTFEVHGTTTFGGTTAAQAPLGPDGIECEITKVS